jgi:hypothetical protein
MTAVVFMTATSSGPAGAAEPAVLLAYEDTGTTTTVPPDEPDEPENDDPDGNPDEEPPAEPTEMPSVEVAQLPSKLTLAPGDAGTITVAVRNPTAATITVDELRVLAPSTLKFAEPSLEASTIEPGDRLTAQFDVVAGSTPGALAVTSIVTVSDVSPTSPRSIEAVTEVTIVEVAPTLEVTFASAPTSASDGQDGAPTAVVIQNSSPYTVTGVQFAYVDSNDLSLRPRVGDECSDSKNDGGTDTTEPVSTEAGSDDDADGVETAPPGLGAVGFSISAGESVTVELCLDVDDLVRAEKQTVGVVVSGTFETPGNPTPVSANATTEIEVTVLGTTFLDVLGPIGVLLFPPIVAIVVFLSLSRVAYPRTSWLPSKLEVKELGNAVWLIPAAAIVYWVAWLLGGVDLTRETSTLAIVVLYGIMMLVGILSWAGFAVGYNRRTGRKRFRPEDTPEKVLERLEHAGSRLTLPTVASVSPTRYILGLGPQGETAVCSKIEFTVDPVDATLTKALTDAIDANDPKQVRKEQGVAKLAWSSAGVQLLDAAQPAGANKVIGEAP